MVATSPQCPAVRWFGKVCDGHRPRRLPAQPRSAAGAQDRHPGGIGNQQFDGLMIVTFDHDARLRSETFHLFQHSVNLAAAGPSHHGTASARLGGAVVVLGFKRVHVGKRLLLELSERAGVLVGLALLLGGVVISALLFDRDACLVHALALGGSVAACSPRSTPWRHPRSCGRPGSIRPVPSNKRIARIALGGGLPVRGAFGGSVSRAASSANGSSSLD